MPAGFTARVFLWDSFGELRAGLVACGKNVQDLLQFMP